MIIFRYSEFYTTKYKTRNNGMLMLTKLYFYKRTRLAIRELLTIRNDSVLTNSLLRVPAVLINYLKQLIN